jgi:hypothetical protein
MKPVLYQAELHHPWLVPSVSIRTDDLSLTGGLLYQLRYEGIETIDAHANTSVRMKVWRALRASNPQPLVLETSALPIELSTRELMWSGRRDCSLRSAFGPRHGRVQRCALSEPACTGLEDPRFTT